MVERHEGEPTQQRQFAPFHCTLGVRWVGENMHPYPAQGRKKEGCPTAQVSLQKALKAINKAEKKERRLQLTRQRQQLFASGAESLSYPLRLAESLQLRLRRKRHLKPYGIVSAIPVYLVLSLLARSLGGALWGVLCSKAWAQPVVGPVENVAAMILSFWMANIRILQNSLAGLLPRGLGRIFASKNYITF